jgi:hypothetical protein
MKIKVLFLIIIVALASCDKDDDENQYPGPDFLKKGNEWNYDLSMKTDGISQSGDFLYKIISQDDDENYTVKATTALQGFPSQDEYENWAVNDVFYLGRDMNLVSVGDSWSEPEDGVDYYTTVLEDNVEVTVPAGSYICRKLRQTQSNDTTLVGYHYYNDDFGVVMTEISYKETLQGQTYTIEQETKLRSTNF